MKRILLFGLLGGLLTTGSGCGLMHAICDYRPCITRTECAPDYGYYSDGRGGDCGCGGGGCESCGEPCSAPARGARRTCYRDPYDDPCWDPCGDPVWDPCGECCHGRPWHRGPLSCLFSLFYHDSWWGDCCGERYWGDFYSDPPDCWDPCDCHGNYDAAGVNPRCCRKMKKYAKNSGYSGYSDEYFDYGMSPGKEQIISETERVISPSPTPASPSPTPASPVHRSVR